MFELAEVETQDGILLQGIIASPTDKKEGALVWIHGLTGNFYGNRNLINTVAKTLLEDKIAFASFNNRGHDMIAGFKRMTKDKSDKSYTYTTIGAGREIFEDCVLDIEAVVSHLVSQGFTKIFLAGHSSGANKVSYYQGSKPNKNVYGTILLSPISDRLFPSEQPESEQQKMELSNNLLKHDQGESLQETLGYFPMTAKRYQSLAQPHSHEDQFGYGDLPPQMPEYSKIKSPLLVVFAEDDECKDRPVLLIKQVFDTTQTSDFYQSEIVAQATHSFDTKINEVSALISHFIKQNL